MSNISAKTVASYFIEKASSQGNGVKELSGNNDLTNLKLQKILYFAQIMYMKENDGRTLFSDEIQAWQYGPVVPSVYEWLRGCGAFVISDFDVELDDTSTLADNIKSFLDRVWNKFQGVSAWGLVQRTHKKGTPWDEVYNNGAGNKRVIGLELLRQAANK